jgi:hypothetical protein
VGGSGWWCGCGVWHHRMLLQWMAPLHLASCLLHLALQGSMDHAVRVHCGSGQRAHSR